MIFLKRSASRESSEFQLTKIQNTLSKSIGRCFTSKWVQKEELILKKGPENLQEESQTTRSLELVIAREGQIKTILNLTHTNTNSPLLTIINCKILLMTTFSRILRLHQKDSEPQAILKTPHIRIIKQKPKLPNTMKVSAISNLSQIARPTKRLMSWESGTVDKKRTKRRKARKRMSSLIQGVNKSRLGWEFPAKKANTTRTAHRMTNLRAISGKNDISIELIFINYSIHSNKKSMASLWSPVRYHCLKTLFFLLLVFYLGNERMRQ